MTNQTAAQRQDIEALLPWHAAGTLGRRDAERVEAALATDSELARQYGMVREELGETIRLNESLGAPSARALETLMAAIEADGATASRRRASFNFAARISAGLTQLRPRTLAWGAMAAVLAIVLQAVLIARMSTGGVEIAEQAPQTQTRGFETAWFSDKTLGTGSFALVNFLPQASAAEITGFLHAYKARVVDGPSPEGYFKVRLSDSKLAPAELDQLLGRIREGSKIVQAVRPSIGRSDQ
jgi:hypothetical protein